MQSWLKTDIYEMMSQYLPSSHSNIINMCHASIFGIFQYSDAEELLHENEIFLAILHVNVDRRATTAVWHKAVDGEDTTASWQWSISCMLGTSWWIIHLGQVPASTQCVILIGFGAITLNRQASWQVQWHIGQGCGASYCHSTLVFLL